MFFTAIISLFFVTIAVSAAPLPDGFVDDRSLLIDYSGSWSEVVYIDAYAGRYRTTSASDAILSFDTYATGITVFFVYAPDGDEVEICIDADCQTISTRGAAAIGNIDISGLADELKTIKIKKVNNDATVFNFDAVYIHPQRKETSQPYIFTDQFDFDGQTYTGAVDLRFSSGDMLIALLLSVSAVSSILKFVYGISR